MVSNNKAPSAQTAPVSPAVKKPVRKAPPPPTSATTPTTSVNGDHDHTPPVSPFNSNDQKAPESPVFIEKPSSNTVKPPIQSPSNSVKPPITSAKPKCIKKSVSVDETQCPPVDESLLVGATKVPPRPPVRGSSLINELDECLRRHSSFEENEAIKAAKPVPKKRTKSVHH